MQASEYFKDSVLFDAKIIAGKPTNSAKSSTVRYELKCKKCDDVNSKTGNNKTLLKCNNCGRSWDRENNTIIEPVGEVKKPAKKVVEKVVEKVIEDDNDEPLPVIKRKITASSIANILKKSAEGTIEKIEPVKTKKLKNAKDVYEIEEIIDYYDERFSDRWRRVYLVRWVGYDKPSFVVDKDFTDKDFLKEFESTLPVDERFASIFTTKNIKNKGSKHAVRTKIDVLQDNGDVSEDKEVVETITTTTTGVVDEPLPEELPKERPKAEDPFDTKDDKETPCVDTSVLMMKVIKLKVGQFYRVGDVLIEAVM